MICEATSTVTTKNQTTVPKIVRKTLDLMPGDKIKYIVDSNGSIRISKSNEKANIWDKAYQQVKKYGSLDTPELDWGKDIEDEII